MKRRVLNVMVCLLAILSLPSTLLFMIILSPVILFGGLADFDMLMVLFVLGCWWGLVALIYGLFHFKQLGLRLLPTWVRLGWLAGVINIALLFATAEINKEIGEFFIAALQGDLDKLPNFLGVVFLFGGAQALLACLLQLKVWLVRTKRMPAPLTSPPNIAPHNDLPSNP
jgi:hypothetical protein